MAYSNNVRSETLKSISNVIHTPFWLDDPLRPAPEPALTKETSTELLIIGAGYSGLWTALLAKEENPNRDIIILEAGEVATGASGRNGGFMSASITHEFSNGLSRWPKELPILLKLGRQNLQEIEETIKRLGIDCDFIPSGDIDMATEPHHIEEIKQEIEESIPFDMDYKFLDRDEVQSIVKSPLFIAGIRKPATALVESCPPCLGTAKSLSRFGRATI